MMKLTQEQELILQSTGNIRINAVAGSGKTTTVIAYAATRPRSSKTLYLAFNRAVKTEAERKFREAGLSNVTVETAHSLAYQNIVRGSIYQVRQSDYKTHEIAELLHIEGHGEKHVEYILANHVSKFVAYFCNSDKEKVQELNYLDVVSDGEAREFVTRFYPYLEKLTRLFLARMDKGEIAITHDFYLKKYQLAQPTLYYDYILFDEGQDASAAMLAVFLQQKAVKVIVGDTHQQIYGWRHAVNSLEKAPFKTYHLSTSFRFPQAIADLAMDVLEWKHHLVADHENAVLQGKGNSKQQKQKAIIARTNLGLLLQAIDYTSERRSTRGIYFEGNINSYTYADEGASLYDVLNLYNGQRLRIRDKLIGTMRNMNELKEYVENTGDAQLGMMIEMVNKYGNEIPGLLKELKDKHVGDHEKDKAAVIFSTVHRCKGMEYDVVHLANDFLSEAKIQQFLRENNDSYNKLKLIEEVNLLYVAITRAKHVLHIPDALVPKEFPASAHVFRVVPESKKASEKETRPARRSSAADNDGHWDYRDEDYWGHPTPSRSQSAKPKEKAYTVEKKRTQHPEAYMSWTRQLDQHLTELFCQGRSLKEMAKQFSRTEGAIESRIKRLGLREKYAVE